MLPLATTFSVSVPLPRLTVLKPASCNADIVTVSLLVLPVRVSTSVTVPSEKSTVVPLVRTMVSLLAPPSIDSPAAKWPLARLIVSLPATRRDRVVAATRRDRVGTRAACDGIGLALPVIEKASVWPDSVIVTPAPAVAAEIASTPWIDASVAPKVLRSDDVDVRLIVSPVPEPRLMVPEPIRIASSWAPVRVTESVPEVPMRLPVSMLFIVASASCEMLPLATTFSVSVPLTRSTVPKPASCNADRVTVSLLVLPVRVSTFVTVPTGEVHRRAVGKDDGVAVGTAVDRLARGEVAVGQVDRVVAATRRDRVGARAAEDDVCRCAARQDVATAESVYCG